MARWKAFLEFLLCVIELLFLSLTVVALQGKMCQNSLLSEGGRSVRAKISGEGVVPGEYFLVSTKLDTFCYLIVQTCLSCEDIARQSCVMVPRWRFLATLLRPVFSASRVQQISYLHLKFTLRPHHVWKYGRHAIYGG